MAPERIHVPASALVKAINPPPLVLLSAMMPLIAFGSVFVPPKVRVRAVLAVVLRGLKSVWVKISAPDPLAVLLLILAPPEVEIELSPINTRRFVLVAPAVRSGCRWYCHSRFVEKTPRPRRY